MLKDEGKLDLPIDESYDLNDEELENDQDLMQDHLLINQIAGKLMIFFYYNMRI